MKYTFVCLTLVLLLVSLSACTSEKDSTLFREFEKNWKACYDDHFSFVSDSNIFEREFITCEIDNQNILINAGSSGYQGITYFSSTGISLDTTVVFPAPGNLKNHILLSFVEFTFLTGFYIQLEYSRDSLNYAIQRSFSNNYLNCASNFIDNGLQFWVGTYCIPNGVIRFSTLYSLEEIQQIKVENFNYELINGKWYYQLEYSAEHLEVTNERWNSRAKQDEFGRPVESNILIEDLQLKDLHGFIEFELKAD